MQAMRRGIPIALVSALLLTSAASATYNGYGTFVVAPDVDAMLKPDSAIAAARLAFQGAPDCSLATTEGVYVDSDNSNAVSIGDIRLVKPSALSVTAMQVVAGGAADIGQALGNEIGGGGANCDDATGIELDAFLRIRVSASGVAGAFLDLDTNNLVSTGDVLLSALAGGTAGTFFAGTSETAAIASTDCVYSAAAAIVADLDVRLTSCGSGYGVASIVSCVGNVADPDCGLTLHTYTPGGVVQFTGAVPFDSTEFAYDDIAADDLVSTGDRRLTPPAAGTITCAGDSNCGAALGAGNVFANPIRISKNTRTPTAFSFMVVDADGDAVATQNDAAYLVPHGAPGAGPGPGSVRLATFGSSAGGTVVAATDADAVLSLLTPTAPPTLLRAGTNAAPTAIALDLDTDGTMDPEDIALLAITSCAAGTLRRAASACDPGGMTAPDGGQTGTFKFYDANTASAAAFNIGDHMFLTLVDADAAVDAGDLRVTATAGAAGTLAAGADLTRAIAAPGSSGIKVIDLDGSGTVTVGDVPVVDVDADSLLTQGDVMLSAGAGMAFGAIAAYGSGPVVHKLVQILGANWEIKFLSISGSLAPSQQDPVYLHFIAENLFWRISARSSTQAAGLLATSDSGLSGLTATPSNALIRSSTATLTQSSDLFVDVAGDGGIGAPDIYLKASGKTPGSKVGSDIIPAPAATIAEATVTPLAYLDLDGSGTLTGLDSIYFNHDNAGETPNFRVNPTDFHLSGTGGSTSLTSNAAATTTTSPPATSGPTTTSAPSTTPPPTTTVPTFGGHTLSDVVANNAALKESLSVSRSNGQNTLTWTAIAGVSGYQIWGTGSAYSLLLTTNDPLQTSYTDTRETATAQTLYVVTAFYIDGSAALGRCTAEQFNAGTCPGVDLTGEAPTTVQVPALPLLLGLAALAAALLVRRRA